MMADKTEAHQSYIFLLPDGQEIRCIPRSLYVALVRRETGMPEYAGERVRVADLYAAIQGEKPVEIVNGTYSFLCFDKAGNADPHRGDFSLDENKAFYDAAVNSRRADIDCDPEVQKVRQRVGDTFSWLPTSKERDALYAMVCRNMDRKD
jgi:hypothetical protein